MLPTIDTLAAALRGIPRDAQLLVRLPDGREVPIAGIEGRSVGESPSAAGAVRAGYVVVILVGE